MFLSGLLSALLTRNGIGVLGLEEMNYKSFVCQLFAR